jgi:hypothetical protein
MLLRYPPTHSGALLAAGLWLLLACAAWAQAPTITTSSPAPNARAVAATSPVTITFSQPLTTSSAAALKVFSAQRGGLRSRGATPATVTGNTLAFAPTAYNFRPGETVFTTITQAAASSGGTLATPRVQQFTAAVGGTGRGTFTAVGGLQNYGVEAMAIGDLDNDGYLDAVSADSDHNYLSMGFGSTNITSLGGPNALSVNQGPFAVALGDVDGDGDLDIVAANRTAATVSVRLNAGHTPGYPGFTGSQDLATTAAPTELATGDLDADGDLDVLVATAVGIDVLVNNGSGVFTKTQNVAVGSTPTAVVVGDVDGDGDLDLVAPNNGAATVSVRLNDGHGTFSGSQNVITGNGPIAVALGDVDGDGDLDLAISCRTEGTVRLALNNGAGVFANSQTLTLQGPYGIALGDFDADGDLDLAIACRYDGYYYVFVNNGAGVFTNATRSQAAGTLSKLVLADVDRDGDLDLVGAGDSKLAIQLNGGTGVLATTSPAIATALALYPNPSATGATLAYTLPTAASLSVDVFDALGRQTAILLDEAQQLPGSHRVAIPRLPAGLYTVRLRLNGTTTYSQLVAE